MNYKIYVFSFGYTLYALAHLLERIGGNIPWPSSCHSLSSLGSVAHTKEEVWQTATQEADLPAIFHKTWQAENSDFLLRLMSACHSSSTSALPTEVRHFV